MSSECLSLPIRAVVFDAVGTVIHPAPAAGEVYATIGRRFGSRLERTEVSARFSRAFAAEERRDRGEGLRTSEAHEEQRWRNIVEDVLDDVLDREGCFQELFAHFGRPESWRCEAGAGELVGWLSAHGYNLALASNYDRRLRGVMAGLPMLRPIESLAISSEIGWRKPAAEFFQALCQLIDCPAARILFIGDDPANDFAGARAAGLQACLFDPHGRARETGARIESLTQVFEILNAQASAGSPQG